MSLVIMPTWSGTKEKKWPIPGTENYIICRYKYFYILASDFGFSYKLQWFLASMPDQEVTREQINSYFPNKKPRLGIWEHYALFIILIPVVFLMLLGF